MRRREFLAGAIGIGGLPQLGAAQDRAQRPVIGIITPHASADVPVLKAFRERLGQLGLVDGTTVEIIYGFADGDLGRMPDLAAAIARKGVAVLVTDGGVVPAGAAKRATSAIPIVAATMGGDPVAEGLVASYSHPGGNLTGFTTAASDIAGKRIEYVKALVPALDHVAVAWNAASSSVPAEVAVQAATALGVAVTRVALDPTRDLGIQIDSAAARHPKALVVLPDGALFHRRADLVASIARAGLPALYPEREYVKVGGLMSYGPVIEENFRGAAEYVAKLLRGTPISELPVQNPSRFEFVVSQPAARAHGIKIAEILLARADEVIE